MPDDAELLRRYADIRDEPAFAALVARHLGLVYASALRRLDGDPHLTEDAACMRTALASRLAAASVKKIAPPGEPSPMPTAAPFHPPPPIPIRASTTVYGPFPATDLRWWNDKAPVSG